MITTERARKLALELSEAREQDHHGRPSFRVRGRIFHTLWDEHHMKADAWERKAPAEVRAAR